MLYMLGEIVDNISEHSKAKYLLYIYTMLPCSADIRTLCTGKILKMK